MTLENTRSKKEASILEAQQTYLAVSRDLYPYSTENIGSKLNFKEGLNLSGLWTPIHRPNILEVMSGHIKEPV